MQDVWLRVWKGGEWWHWRRQLGTWVLAWGPRVHGGSRLWRGPPRLDPRVLSAELVCGEPLLPARCCARGEAPQSCPSMSIYNTQSAHTACMVLRRAAVV